MTKEDLVFLGDRLKIVRDRFKKGCLDVALLRDVTDLHASTANFALDDLLLFKVRCLAAEVFDHFGRRSEAKLAVRQGEEMSEALKIAPAGDRASLKLAREKVRYVADYARVTLYRDHRYVEAKNMLVLCRDYVIKHLQRDEEKFHCAGTMAQISYYLGCALRQLGEYDEADEVYRQAIDYSRERAEHRVGDSGADDPAHIELLFSRWRSGLALGLGLGWVNATQGHLNQSLKDNISPAQVLLMGTNDSITNAYLKLNRGAIVRSLAGSNPGRLKEATKWVLAAYKVFREGDYAHPDYAARAAHELAICLLYLNEYEKAIAELDAAKNLLQNSKEWTCKIMMLRSRIKRRSGDASAAMELAIAARGLVPELNIPTIKIDSLIVLGEAHRLQRNPKEARVAFEDALSSMHPPGLPPLNNPKVEGVLYLHIADTYLDENQPGEAAPWLERWNRLKNSVEHRMVHEIGNAVEQRLNNFTEDFKILWQPSDQALPELNFEKNSIKLRKWLVKRAHFKNSQKNEIAKLLGISRVTLDDWERKGWTKTDPETETLK